MKKLLIDIDSIVPYYVSGKLNGIGRTTLELINALDNIKKDIPFEIALYSQNMKGIGGKNTGLSFKNKHLYFPHREKKEQFLKTQWQETLMIPAGYPDIICINTEPDGTGNTEKGKTR